MQTSKMLNLGLFLSFFLCYLEWNNGKQHIFVAGAVWEILSNYKSYASNFTHPLILAGLLGLAGLLYSAIANKPRVWINVSSVALLSLVVALLLVIGILSKNWKMIFSSVPFAILSAIFFIGKVYKK